MAFSYGSLLQTHCSATYLFTACGEFTVRMTEKSKAVFYGHENKQTIKS
jgi:hypothetical protein